VIGRIFFLDAKRSRFRATSLHHQGQAGSHRFVADPHGWHATLRVVRKDCLWILPLTVGRLPSQNCNRSSRRTIPLCKVIVGPAPTTKNRTRKGPVFSQ
jgi:hypothetical protein